MSPEAQQNEQLQQAALKQRGWLEWLTIGEGLSGLVAVLALIVALAEKQPSASATPLSAPAASASSMAGMPGMAPTTAGQPVAVKMSMKSDTEHGRRGPDGTWRDAAVPALFTVHAGATVTMTVQNYDTPHSFTSPGLGVSQIMPAGTASNPSMTTVKFTAPLKPGRYLWYCNIPCDPWAMMHIGYMRGYVTVVA